MRAEEREEALRKHRLRGLTPAAEQQAEVASSDAIGDLNSNSMSGNIRNATTHATSKSSEPSFNVPKELEQDIEYLKRSVMDFVAEWEDKLGPLRKAASTGEAEEFQWMEREGMLKLLQEMRKVPMLGWGFEFRDQYFNDFGGFIACCWNLVKHRNDWSDETWSWPYREFFAEWVNVTLQNEAERPMAVDDLMSNTKNFSTAFWSYMLMEVEPKIVQIFKRVKKRAQEIRKWRKQKVTEGGS